MAQYEVISESIIKGVRRQPGDMVELTDEEYERARLAGAVKDDGTAALLTKLSGGNIRIDGKPVKYSGDVAARVAALRADGGGDGTDPVAREMAQTVAKTTDYLVKKGGFAQRHKGRCIVWLSTHTISSNWEYQLKLLNEEGVPSIFMSEAYEFLEGRLELPELAVVIRADDAPRSWYTSAYPLLKQYGHKMTMYFSLWHQVTMEPSGSLTDANIQEMIREGVGEIQFHAGLWGHQPDMPTNGSGATDYYHAARKWLPDEGRQENLTEFRQRMIEDVDSWLEWYDRVVRPVHPKGGTTLHYAPPNGLMGQPGDTRPTWLEVLKEKNILTSTWKNHMQWMTPGFKYTDGGRSVGESNAYYDLPGIGTENQPWNVVRNFIHIAKMDYMTDTRFASKFDYPAGGNSDWYVQSQNGGDVFARNGEPLMTHLHNASLLLTFGATPTAGTSFWKRTLPDNDLHDTYLQVIVGIPAGFAMPISANLAITHLHGAGSNLTTGAVGQSIWLTTDAGGTITAKSSHRGTTAITLGTVSVPETGINWYTLETHVERSALGANEAWFNHNYCNGSQRGINTVLPESSNTNALEVGRVSTLGLTGLVGSLLFARVVVDTKYIGRRGLIR